MSVAVATEKRCNRCDRRRPLDDFYKSKGRAPCNTALGFLADDAVRIACLLIYLQGAK